ncbi:hypothetical protein D2A34_26330 [Clostridium chromiireducens]|uniref:Uncharacterized protein n=1 Tax=Clostridium chromiireducens TaxID=225345 RepID=A0A399IG80_9CLOT|nr:hypothetical protein D2A34_26330 [Clostridium chromiireducens]
MATVFSIPAEISSVAADTYCICSDNFNMLSSVFFLAYFINVEIHINGGGGIGSEVLIFWKLEVDN